MQLESASLHITVLPEVGGKVARIFDKRSNRSLLVSPQTGYRTVPVGDSWMNYDKSGMDDCFPNIARGIHPDRGSGSIVLPDLGEWVYGTWEAVFNSRWEIALQRRGTSLPYQATKRIAFVNDDTLRFDYSIAHCGDAPFRYMWCAHPLFAVDGAFAVRLPGTRLLYRKFPFDGEIRHWPVRNEIDLSRQWIPQGTTLKTFVSGLEEGWCELSVNDQSLRLGFDLKVTPFLGIWFNNFGFPQEAPYRCIALEPCTSQSDLLDPSEGSWDPVLSPGAKAEWWFTLQVSALAP